MKHACLFLTITSLTLFTLLFGWTLRVHAQTITTTPTPAPTGTPTPTPTPPVGSWVQDADVTFAGKMASRSASFFDWTVRSYNWSTVPAGKVNPLIAAWITVRNTIYALLLLFVLTTAFLIIVTRGQSITALQFIPRFILVALLITFSFSLLQFLYQVTDVVQGFFFKNLNGTAISSKDLLSVGVDYKTFEGYRLSGTSFDESVKTSLLLIKTTAITYYTMAGVLLLRKIILWFFIIISPLFALLLFYYPIRNTAKIWLGEFFRWLLYGPLFSALLFGLVTLWSLGIPLGFNFGNAGKSESVVYPTAVSILLGGPGQNISVTNSLNYTDTFALYVVSLLMLWVVILLPFLLLKIFLDYFRSVSISESTVWKIIKNSSFVEKGTEQFKVGMWAPFSLKRTRDEKPPS